MDDETTFRELFATTYEDLLRFVERRVHPLAAEDVVADVFLVAWRRLEDVPVVPDEARAWLFGVAQRTMANQRRGDARRLSLQVRVGQTQAQVEDDHSADVEARVDLGRAWSKLRPSEQEALTLVGLDGLTGPQAARVIGISATAFSVRLMRARRRLRTHMRRAAGSPAVQARPTPPGDTYAVSTPPPSHQEPS